jgi:glutamate-ammonia-ligase adenylyltransferase
MMVHAITSWPAPADRGAGKRLLERFSDLGSTEAKLARAAPVAAMLQCLGGNSPYLADLVIREAASVRLILRLGPAAVVASALAALGKIPPNAPGIRIASEVRAAKRVVALAIAIADIGGVWTLEQVTEALSTLAQATLGLVVAHLLRDAHDRGELTLPFKDDPARACGFVALGMGKLGAGELNYSSDIDLILLYDPDAGVYHGDAPTAFYTRLARNLVTLMEARDADGYVFRTDLRLRPDPAATPPCIALPAAIAYYESMGQNWERAAMLKARPVAGDLALGAQFLGELRPFVWRRQRDFAAIADIGAMKRRIDVHRASATSYNVKLGAGGIREIEFLTQTLQMVWGGHDPGLRDPRTLPALKLLVKAGHLPRRTQTALEKAYRFLRQVEHRLQMVADRQTHSLPETDAGLADFACFMGFVGPGEFENALLRHRAHVQNAYRALFGVAAANEATALNFAGSDDIPAETAAALTAMGFSDPDKVATTVRAWRAGRPRALRSARAQELMAHLLPSLLAALARQSNPASALARFDDFLTRLPSGVALLSLLQHYPDLLGRITAVLGASPMLADHLARHPAALEGLLAPRATPDYLPLLTAQLGDAEMLEDSIVGIRTTVREEEFAIAVATLEGRMDADTAGIARTALSDAAIGALLAPVLADFARRFGKVRGGRLAVVLMGKAGGREMMAGSDLDLMLIYDHPEKVQNSTAASPARSLPASQYFIRAVHAYIAALTAPDADGPMYAVDMRLRPSGNKGPVAVSLAGFERYHRPINEGEGAWTYERMALTRARVVAGPPALRRKIEAAIRAAIADAGAPEKIRADAAAMRARLLRDLPPSGPWDVKLRPGGQIEVEFITQTLQLIHPALANPTTRVALQNLADAGVLAEADAALLIRADRTWRDVQGLLRIAYGRNPPEPLSTAAASALLAVVPAIDMADLRATLEQLAADVRAAFIRIIGDPTS